MEVDSNVAKLSLAARMLLRLGSADSNMSRHDGRVDVGDGFDCRIGLGF